MITTTTTTTTTTRVVVIAAVVVFAFVPSLFVIAFFVRRGRRVARSLREGDVVEDQPFDVLLRGQSGEALVAQHGLQVKQLAVVGAVRVVLSPPAVTLHVRDAPQRGQDRGVAGVPY